MTLTEFLLARIAEDEAAAKAASPGPWHLNAEHDEVLAVDDITVCDGFALSGPQTRATTEHITRHDPARVLAECAAKREAIGAAWRDHCQIEGEWGSSQSREQMSAKNDNPGVVIALASVFADHPDYRAEWAL